ncbi:hypothetical protein EVAR_4647_1 [Eumeta japonica]|uniref:Uncharacterized protein n=1 Tax=Eumeta variegata TaxID=151549 RepID=A0A4C1YBP7_EUMVA|nr:hypothetical protein EVAR_4647_1 [Eumeta japonica]
MHVYTPAPQRSRGAHGASAGAVGRPSLRTSAPGDVHIYLPGVLLRECRKKKVNVGGIQQRLQSRRLRECAPADAARRRCTNLFKFQLALFKLRLQCLAARQCLTAPDTRIRYYELNIYPYKYPELLVKTWKESRCCSALQSRGTCNFIPRDGLLRRDPGSLRIV